MADGVRHKVFCASLADVFDNHQSTDPEWRRELWRLIMATPHLDWLLLTKRPKNIKKFLPDDWGSGYQNVWLGTTVENQEEADRRIPHLLDVPAKVRFLSCEPLLGPVDVFHFLKPEYECTACRFRTIVAPSRERCRNCGAESMEFGEFCSECDSGEYPVCVCPDCDSDMVCCHPDTPIIDWIIAGGESGPNARPSHPDWFRSLRDQCGDADVPFFFKQWGEWFPFGEVDADGCTNTVSKGKRPGYWYEWFNSPDTSVRLGRRAAGRALDGVIWDQMPEGTK